MFLDIAVISGVGCLTARVGVQSPSSVSSWWPLSTSPTASQLTSPVPWSSAWLPEQPMVGLHLAAIC